MTIVHSASPAHAEIHKTKTILIQCLTRPSENFTFSKAIKYKLTFFPIYENFPLPAVAQKRFLFIDYRHYNK